MTVLVKISKASDYKNQIQVGAGVSIADRVQDSTKDGRQAIKFLSKTSDHRPNEASNRTEAAIGRTAFNWNPPDGTTDYTGFGLWLPEYPYEANFTIWQLWAHPETGFKYFGLGFGEDGKLSLTGNDSVRYDPPKGKWSQWLIRIKHSSQGKGEVEVFVDGTRRFLSTGLTRIGSNGTYQKHGIYKGVKSRDGKRPLPDCHLWIADFRIATTKAEVEGSSPPPPSDFNRGWNGALDEVQVACARLRR